MDKGNGCYNLIVLCWDSGQGSCIHDHADSHCFMKVRRGRREGGEGGRGRREEGGREGGRREEGGKEGRGREGGKEGGREGGKEGGGKEGGEGGGEGREGRREGTYTMIALARKYNLTVPHHVKSMVTFSRACYAYVFLVSQAIGYPSKLEPSKLSVYIHITCLMVLNVFIVYKHRAPLEAFQLCHAQLGTL